MRFIRLTLLLLILAACTTGVQPDGAVARPTPALAPVVSLSDPTPTPEPQPSPTPRLRLAAIDDTISPEMANRLRDGLAAVEDLQWIDAGGEDANRFAFVPSGQAETGAVSETIYAVVAPFATVRDGVTWDELKQRWDGDSADPLYVLQSDAAALSAVFGSPPAEVVAAGELLSHLTGRSKALGLLAFDQLDPAYKVLAVDGAQPLDKDFTPGSYPLALALTIAGPDAGELREALADAFPAINRDPARLTTLIMTGVTAMSRMTAQRMERNGYDYPARVIGPTLRQADITHVSNEVPFIPGCKVNASANNLRFCSDTTYWAALEAIGVDIVGLSGNHVNDFGRKGARQSLAFYDQKGVGIYGSGLDEAQACQPLLWEHNGNTFAFIAALAYQPRSAWATPTEPGACYYYSNENKILDLVRQLSTQVDVVAVELQHYERYNPRPTPKQIREFRQLRQAGADIVTGVQSHVPQAIEPYGANAGAGVIAYGLGNLFFDQMWSWQTRTSLILRHTLYDGRLLNTAILTTVLENYAQPRWATASERARVLQRIFDAAPTPLSSDLPPS